MLEVNISAIGDDIRSLYLIQYDTNRLIGSHLLSMAHTVLFSSIYESIYLASINIWIDENKYVASEIIVASMSFNYYHQQTWTLWMTLLYNTEMSNENPWHIFQHFFEILTQLDTFVTPNVPTFTDSF